MEKRGERSRVERGVESRAFHPESLMMGFGYDPKLSEGALKCPLFLTSTFVFESAEDGKAFFEIAYGLREKGPAEEPGLIYSRINNPDLEILEDRLALWDHADDALVFSSGMAAISTTLLTFLRPGDVIVYAAPVYGGTEFLLQKILPSFGIRPVEFQAGQGGATLEDAVKEAAELGRIGMIYFETPTNPTNALVDIEKCAAVAASLADADGNRPLVAVDNTFLGPVWQQPLEHGADLVLYSLTKYVSGHSDLIAGACLASEPLIASVRGMRTILGTMADPWTGWLLMRSLETLKLRMEGQMRTARHIAEFLRDHARVKRVLYLGFIEEDSPQGEIYRKQCASPGSTFSFEVEGGEAEAFRFLNHLSLVKLAVSLGGTESLAQHPASMTHSDIAPADQARMGITPGMVRLSVGVEHPDDIIADLATALDAI